MELWLRKYLIKESIISVVFNFIVGAFFALLFFYSLETVPLRGEQSIAGDSIIAAFMIPFFTCFILTALTRHRIRMGSIPEYECEFPGPLALRILPASIMLRSILVGCIGVMVVIPLVMGVFATLDLSELSFKAFFFFKSVLAAAIAAIIAPLAILTAVNKFSG